MHAESSPAGKDPLTPAQAVAPYSAWPLWAPGLWSWSPCAVGWTLRKCKKQGLWGPGSGERGSWGPDSFTTVSAWGWGRHSCSSGVLGSAVWSSAWVLLDSCGNHGSAKCRSAGILCHQEHQCRAPTQPHRQGPPMPLALDTAGPLSGHWALRRPFIGSWCLGLFSANSQALTALSFLNFLNINVVIFIGTL